MRNWINSHNQFSESSFSAAVRTRNDVKLSFFESEIYVVNKIARVTIVNIIILYSKI